MARPRDIRFYEGKEFLRCCGDLHPDGEWLPIENFRRRNDRHHSFGRSHSCNDCISEYHRKRREEHLGTPSGWVLRSEWMWVFDELIGRLGKAETARRLGMSKQFISSIYGGKSDRNLGQKKKYRRFRRHTVAKALQLLNEVRKNDEVRHRKSISRGTSVRGESERKPVKARDFYTRPTDQETETRKIWKRRKKKQDDPTA